jgi:hypothetical protein
MYLNKKTLLLTHLRKNPKKCTLIKDPSPDPLEKNTKTRYLNKGPFTSIKFHCYSFAF